MALGLYKLSDGLGEISDDNTYSNPVVWETAPAGGILEGKYYLRMENPLNEYLTEGRMYSVDVSGTDESGWFEFAEDDAGGAGEYGPEFEFEIPLGSEIQVWIKLTVPSGIEIEPKDDVRLAASYIGHEI
jgi:hypothetical protein